MESKMKKRGGRYCVAGAPNKQSCQNTSYTDGIRMHQFPTDPVVRAKWVKFVQRHRADFKEPVSKSAALCSVHFEESCYTSTSQIASQLEGYKEKVKKILKKGSVPPRDTILPAFSEISCTLLLQFVDP